ncbi:spore coat protein U domain-containing protein [Frateuria sp. YIM B11624]|uniref:spore coat protein U domain-containing protein n=1 Tax=Frateuria sp. YIM B11624 TaxID=3143185 RepID=UPI003C713640
MASRFGKFVVGGLAASLLTLLPGPSAAEQASATLRVTLRVVASCSVQTQPLALSDYTSGGQATGTASPGAIDVTCARGTPAAVYLEGNRTLQGPSGDRVAYEVRANGAPWRAGEAIHVKGMGQTPVHLALSGSVPAGQKVAMGDYEDQVVVRVVY